jgi:hypothetical protein
LSITTDSLCRRVSSAEVFLCHATKVLQDMALSAKIAIEKEEG